MEVLLARHQVGIANLPLRSYHGGSNSASPLAKFSLLKVQYIKRTKVDPVCSISQAWLMHIVRAAQPLLSNIHSEVNCLTKETSRDVTLGS